jgi:uncharacterized protein (TIGR03435 family)
MTEFLFRSFLALMLVCGYCGAQSSDSPRFEVVSVKLLSEAGGLQSFSGGPGSDDPERVTIERVPMRDLILTAYGVEPYQVSGPAWITAERYSVTAKLPKGTTHGQLRQMMANLLAERFGLVLHRVRKQFAGYEIDLTPGRAPRLTPAPAKAEGEATFRGEPIKDGLVRYTFTQTSMEMLANRVSIMIPRRGPGRIMAPPPVRDGTGLNGKFDFQLDITQPTTAGLEAAHDVEDNSGSIADALRNQLGLKLNRVKIELDELVIDHLNRLPSEN